MLDDKTIEMIKLFCTIASTIAVLFGVYQAYVNLLSAKAVERRAKQETAFQMVNKCFEDSILSANRNLGDPQIALNDKMSDIVIIGAHYEIISTCVNKKYSSEDIIKNLLEEPMKRYVKIYGEHFIKRYGKKSLDDCITLLNRWGSIEDPLKKKLNAMLIKG